MEFNYFDDRPQDVVLEHRRRVNAQIHQRFRIRDTSNPLDMSINEFERVYRMPQDAVVDLANIIRPHMPDHNSPQQTPLIRKLLVTLGVYSMGSYQRILGRVVDCSVSQTSVSRFVKEITYALQHPAVLTRFIKFPLTREERAPIIARNLQVLKMQRVLGCIDGFLVKVSQLPRDDERQSFFSRKGWPALNCQIICDADLRILNVDARWPGSENDHTIWGTSSVRPVMEQAYWQDRCWLLGDSGYHTAPWLHVPLRHALPGTPQFDYTNLHCSARNCVGRCIGVLKARWRILCLDRCLNYRDAGYSGRLINACCVLHNFCLGRAPPVLPVLENPHEDILVDNHLPLNLQQRGIAEIGRNEFSHQLCPW